jgi:hypothetical protein
MLRPLSATASRYAELLQFHGDEDITKAHTARSNGYFRAPPGAYMLCSSPFGNTDGCFIFRIFADLRDRPCLVVGGGAVALRKVRLLVSAGRAGHRQRARAPPGIGALAASRAASPTPRAASIPRTCPAWCWQSRQPAIPQSTAAYGLRASALRLLVNSVDDPAASSFIVPAIVDRSPLVVAVSSGGTAHRCWPVA